MRKYYAFEKTDHEAITAVLKAGTLRVAEKSPPWQHRIHWLWVALFNVLTVSFIVPNRHRMAFSCSSLADFHDC